MKNVSCSKEALSDPYAQSASFYPVTKMLVLLCCCFNAVISIAQEHEDVEEPFRQHHAVALLLSHTNTSQGIEDGKKKWLTMPSWALDYNYFFSRSWSVGLHNDMILETFKVQEHESDGEIIERTRPVSSVAVVSYKPGRYFSYELGVGAEFANEHNYLLSRVGVEYALELPDEWELISNIIWDLKWDAYNSLGIGIGVGKSFGFRKNKKSPSGDEEVSE